MNTIEQHTTNVWPTRAVATKKHRDAWTIFTPVDGNFEHANGQTFPVAKFFEHRFGIPEAAVLILDMANPHHEQARDGITVDVHDNARSRGEDAADRFSALCHYSEPCADRYRIAGPVIEGPTLEETIRRVEAWVAEVVAGNIITEDVGPRAYAAGVAV